jgi:endonuclease/exonuclease/phosphatase family metal-dependent hydrolase
VSYPSTAHSLTTTEAGGGRDLARPIGEGRSSCRAGGPPLPGRRSFLIASPTARLFFTLAVLAWALVPQARAAQPRTLDVVTYNVHSGLGSTGAFARPRGVVEENLARIAEAIAALPTTDGPVDVVALNEVDFGSRRSGWMDQADFVAGELRRRTGERYAVVRGETWRRRTPGFEVRFGNAVLVRHPIRRARSCLLDEPAGCAPGAAPVGTRSLRAPGFWSWMLRETRGVVALGIEIDGLAIDVLATHLDAFVQAEREAQASFLVSRMIDPEIPTVLLGDMNAVPAPLVRPVFPSDRTGELLTSGALRDARGLVSSDGAERWPTFPAAAPLWPLDWILATVDLHPEAVETVGDTASDHLGLYTRYRLPPRPDGRALVPVAHRR